MSYKTIKDGIANILKGLELQESEQGFSFINASSNEYENTFILRCVSGELGREDISSGFTDKQPWEIDVAFPKSSESDVINILDIHNLKDNILSAVDSPTNWLSFARLIKYKSWKLTEQASYYLLTVTVDVTDTYTY